MVKLMPVRLVGYEQGGSTIDVVTIFATSVKIDLVNPILVLPIASSVNTATLDTKLLNLRRVNEKVIVKGFITDSTVDGSRTGVSLTSYGATTGGSAMTSVMQKFKAIRSIAYSGSVSGKCSTFQWRMPSDFGSGVGTTSTMTDSSKSWSTNQWQNGLLIDRLGACFVVTSSTSTALTVSGTPASGSYTVAKFETSGTGSNLYHEVVAIAQCTAEDNVNISEPAYGNQPAKMEINLTLYYGNPVT